MGSYDICVCLVCASIKNVHILNKTEIMYFLYCFISVENRKHFIQYISKAAVKRRCLKDPSCRKDVLMSVYLSQRTFCKYAENITFKYFNYE